MLRKFFLLFLFWRRDTAARVIDMTSAKRDSASRQFLHISVKWITVNKSRLIGITVSSSKDRGAVEISKRLSIKSAVTVCSKCGMATGMVFYDARSNQPSYCTKSCIRTAPYTGHRFSIPTADLSQAERRTVTKYSRPLISSVHQFSLQDIALQLF